MHDLELITLPNGKIQINANKYGLKIEGIAFIHESDSPNPQIKIPNPLGVLVIIEILMRAVEQLREQYTEERLIQFNLMNSADSLADSHHYLELFLANAQEKEQSTR